MTRPSHFCAYIQRKQKEDLKEGPALPSLQHFFFFFFSKKSRQGNKLSVYQWMNGQRRFGVYMPEIELLRVTRTFQ